MFRISSNVISWPMLRNKICYFGSFQCIINSTCPNQKSWADILQAAERWYDNFPLFKLCFAGISFSFVCGAFFPHLAYVETLSSVLFCRSPAAVDITTKARHFSERLHNSFWKIPIPPPARTAATNAPEWMFSVGRRISKDAECRGAIRIGRNTHLVSSVSPPIKICEIKPMELTSWA